ncbi:hypothetical protein Goarm_022230 [Gossypium armourianum]|uniref:Terpene synthase metal-binding domain-containing protein n=1 Tax=Gossypium armourianum TaxID=34283 RepID=A0A7J9KH87_9ROSI|nr:hypothetical protein [Gossypium armourianum]
MLTVTSFVGMEDFVTPEIFNWASNNPKIIDASSIAIRLMNDVTSHKVSFFSNFSKKNMRFQKKKHVVN